MPPFKTTGNEENPRLRELATLFTKPLAHLAAHLSRRCRSLHFKSRLCPRHVRQTAALSIAYSATYALPQADSPKLAGVRNCRVHTDRGRL